jgi:hypothetical protein
VHVIHLYVVDARLSCHQPGHGDLAGAISGELGPVRTKLALAHRGQSFPALLGAFEHQCSASVP